MPPKLPDVSNYIFKSIKAKWIDDGLLLTLFPSFLPSFLIQFIICFKKNIASKEDKAPAPNFNVLQWPKRRLTRIDARKKVINSII